MKFDFEDELAESIAQIIDEETSSAENLYKDKGLTILEEDKTYFVSFKNRNKKDVKHLIIMNYLVFQKIKMVIMLKKIPM